MLVEPIDLDRCRVDLTRPGHTDYWTQELGVSEAELIGAIRVAGVLVNAIRRHLGK